MLDKKNQIGDYSRYDIENKNQLQVEVKYEAEVMDV